MLSFVPYVSIALRIEESNSAILLSIVSASSGLFSIILTIALPTITPSETAATDNALSASLIPKPTATGKAEITLIS